MGGGLGAAASAGAMPQHSAARAGELLASALRCAPQASDSSRSKPYTPRAPASIPASYPSGQAAAVDNPALFDRLDADTLFFAFYFHAGTRAQLLAARALKRQGWRFHLKYNTWFQRHDEPTAVGDDYETGTYAYFDPSGDGHEGWVQRIRANFMLEYRAMASY